jgi:hypothetical protein
LRMRISAYFIKKKAVTYGHAREHLAQAQKKKKQNKSDKHGSQTSSEGTGLGTTPKDLRLTTSNVTGRNKRSKAATTEGGTTAKGTQGARPRAGEPPPWGHLIGDTTMRRRKHEGPSATLRNQPSTPTGAYN